MDLVVNWFLRNWINWFSLFLLFNDSNIMNYSTPFIYFLSLDYPISVIYHFLSYWLLNSILPYTLNPANNINIIAVSKPFLNSCACCNSSRCLSSWRPPTPAHWFYSVFFKVGIVCMTRPWYFVERVVIWWNCIGVSY